MLVDTNVLICAADRAAPEHGECRAFVERCREDSLPWYLTWGVVYEFVRVVTHPRVLQYPRSVDEAWHFVAALQQTPNCGILVATPRHADVAAQVIEEHQGLLRGNLLHAAQTVVLMHEHGIRQIATRDADFHRFGSVEVIDPVTVT